MSFCEDEICHDKHIPFEGMLGIKVKAKPKIIIANINKKDIIASRLWYGLIESKVTIYKN